MRDVSRGDTSADSNAEVAGDSLFSKLRVSEVSELIHAAAEAVEARVCFGIVAFDKLYILYGHPTSMK